MMRRALLLSLVVLATPASADGAPLSPSMQFAYDVAVAHVSTPSNCTSMDVQTVPGGPDGFAAIASPFVAEPEPCFIYMARWLAPVNRFGNACRTFYNALGTMWGSNSYYPAMPRACRDRALFLMNHPHYLERRHG